jgi:hypothetical protein
MLAINLIAIFDIIKMATSLYSYAVTQNKGIRNFMKEQFIILI